MEASKLESWALVCLPLPCDGLSAPFPPEAAPAWALSEKKDFLGL